ncbi:MAG: hypothetical protein MUO62_19640 [Anaerolineales bacterium]|nr:hypothetical protein [Anaerolineales bacterium]
MINQQPPTPLHVLIASSHTLFGKGISSLLENRWGDQVKILGLVTSLEETLQALTSLMPNLLIVDYDDEHLNRDEFLGYFIKEVTEIRIVLLSLKNGHEGADAIVYDRKTLSASKIEDWLQIDSNHPAAGRGETK